MRALNNWVRSRSPALHEKWLIKEPSKPWVAVVLTILSLLIGTYGSVHTLDIQASVPFCWWILDANGQRCTFNFEVNAIAFYCFLLVFAVLFWLREKAVIFLARKAQYELRTMPRPETTQIFDHIRNEVVWYLNLRREAIKQGKDIDVAIRNCLYGLITMAEVISEKEGRYAANIMLYIPITEIGEGAKESISDNLRLFSDPPTFENLRGVLQLYPDLSTAESNEQSSADDSQLNSEEDDTHPPDKHLLALAMPVPNQTHRRSDEERQLYFPGAPAAFFEGFHLIEDTHNLLSDYYSNDSYKELGLGFFKRSDTYFREIEQGSFVRSFLSIALSSHVDENREQQNVIGVLNIHCDAPGMLDQEWVLRSYVCLARPILAEIYKLLLEWKKTGNSGDIPTSQVFQEAASQQRAQSA